MFILKSANNIWLNVLLFVMIIGFVVLLPLIDHAVCRKLKLNLWHGISENPNARRLLKLRQVVLYIILFTYLLINFYLVFWSRNQVSEYVVNTRFMYDFKHSINIDIGVFGLIKDIFSQGFRAGFSHIHVKKLEDITQVLTNTMFYIPMGYLLPYTIERLRNKKRYTVVFCFLFSFLTENIQLTFRRGMYDLDDLFFNTLGGLIGYLLFVAFAYWLTRPKWKKEDQLRFRWILRSYKKILFFSSKEMQIDRISVAASSEEEIHAFYIDKLGFQLRGLSFSQEGMESAMLMSLGNAMLEFRCQNDESILSPQKICLKVKRLDRLRRKLLENGVEVSDYLEDEFSHRRMLQVNAPDHVTIVFTE